MIEKIVLVGIGLIVGGLGTAVLVAYIAFRKRVLNAEMLKLAGAFGESQLLLATLYFEMVQGEAVPEHAKTYNTDGHTWSAYDEHGHFWIRYVGRIDVANNTYVLAFIQKILQDHGFTVKNHLAVQTQSTEDVHGQLLTEI